MLTQEEMLELLKDERVRQLLELIKQSPIITRRYFITDNILIEYSEGQYDLNHYGQYWRICAQFVYGGNNMSFSEFKTKRYESKTYLLHELTEAEVAKFLARCEEDFKTTYKEAVNIYSYPHKVVFKD